MMRAKKSTIVIVYLILVGVFGLWANHALAVPANNLNKCAAWLSTYQQFHPDDKDTSILLSDFEGEMKRLDQYSTDQIENALDLQMMESAAENSHQTVVDLMYCRDIAINFTRNQK